MGAPLFFSRVVAGSSVSTCRRFVPISDSSARKIVWRKFERYAITDQHTNLELRHLAGRVRQNRVPVFEQNSKVAVRKNLRDHSLHFDSALLRHSANPPTRAGGFTRKKLIPAGQTGHHFLPVATTTATPSAAAAPGAIP